MFIVLMNACSEDWMTIHPEGSTVDEETKDAVSEVNDAAWLAQLLAMPANLIDYGQTIGWATWHGDYGYPSICMALDYSGQDMCCGSANDDHFSSFIDYKVGRGYTYLPTYTIWNTFYPTILNCNNLIESIPERDHSSDKDEYLAGAMCFRAFCYLELAQLYQYTYVGNKDKPCVPIVRDSMTADQMANNPRASVKDVYDFIMKDLNYAIASEQFQEFQRSSIALADLSVAYGLRARANLIMQKYDEASSDAENCLKASGASCLSRTEVNEPGFCEAGAKNVIWAELITENNRCVTTGICNWPSMLSSFYLDGYTGVGAYRAMASSVYARIPISDVRKGWWLDDNYQSPLLRAASYKAQPEYNDFISTITDKSNVEHINVKFGTRNSKFTTLAAATGDWIVMRAEEMELIKAECAAAKGDGSVLENFVRTYRDPSYTIKGDLMDAVWFQRRIELWGEGFALLDLLRFQKSITERSASSNWNASYAWDIPWQDLLFLIPQDEVVSNGAISEEDNNEETPIPF